jgi:hypothetical protein
MFLIFFFPNNFTFAFIYGSVFSNIQFLLFFLPLLPFQNGKELFPDVETIFFLPLSPFLLKCATVEPSDEGCLCVFYSDKLVKSQF